MKSSPVNTAVFLIVLNPLVRSEPGFQDNLEKTIKAIQECGFEPYVTTPFIELLGMSNLFIACRGFNGIVDILPYLRENNVLLYSAFDWDRDELNTVLNKVPQSGSVTFMVGMVHAARVSDKQAMTNQIERKFILDDFETITLEKTKLWTPMISLYQPPVTTVQTTPYG